MADAGRVAFVTKEDWKIDEQYERLDVVSHGEYAWICCIDNVGVEPRETAPGEIMYWMQLVKKTAVENATYEKVGVVMPDGESILIDQTGKISVDREALNIPEADNETIINNEGTLSVPTADADTLGLVKVDDETIKAVDGLIAVDKSIARANIIGKPYDASKPDYVKGDIVIDNNLAYKVITATVPVGTPTSNTTYYKRTEIDEEIKQINTDFSDTSENVDTLLGGVHSIVKGLEYAYSARSLSFATALLNTDTPPQHVRFSFCTDTSSGLPVKTDGFLITYTLTSSVYGGQIFIGRNTPGIWSRSVSNNVWSGWIKI